MQARQISCAALAAARQARAQLLESGAEAWQGLTCAALETSALS